MLTRDPSGLQVIEALYPQCSRYVDETTCELGNFILGVAPRGGSLIVGQQKHSMAEHFAAAYKRLDERLDERRAEQMALDGCTAEPARQPAWRSIR